MPEGLLFQSPGTNPQGAPRYYQMPSKSQKVRLVAWDVFLNQGSYTELSSMQGELPSVSWTTQPIDTVKHKLNPGWELWTTHIKQLVAPKRAEREILTLTQSMSSVRATEVEAVEVEALPTTMTERTLSLGDDLGLPLAGLPDGCLAHLFGLTGVRPGLVSTARLCLSLRRDRLHVYGTSMLHILLLGGKVDITDFFTVISSTLMSERYLT